jgi:hypothetical protein
MNGLTCTVIFCVADAKVNHNLKREVLNRMEAVNIRRVPDVARLRAMLRGGGQMRLWLISPPCRLGHTG